MQSNTVLYQWKARLPVLFIHYMFCLGTPPAFHHLFVLKGGEEEEIGGKGMGEFVLISFTIFCVLVLSWAWRVLNSIWWRPKRLERCLKEQGIMGPPYKLLYGDLKENARLIKEARSKPINLSHDIVQRVTPFVYQMVKNYGKMSVFWEGTSAKLIILEPYLTREILTNNSGHFEKPQRNALLTSLGNGLATYRGEKWARHRRIINPAFHLEKLKCMLPAFYTCCNELVRRWEKLVTSEGSCEMDVWPELQNLTGDVISRAAFGSDYEEGLRIFQLIYELAKLVSQVAQSVYIPGFRFIPTKRNNIMKEMNGEIVALVRGIVDKREKALKVGEGSIDDLLGLLMQSNYQDIQEHGNRKKVGMSIEEIIEECKHFYSVGHETVTVLLVWTMVVLSMHQDWQVRAREEVLQVFGNNKPNFDGLNHLKVVTMILYEVLRLYPPVVMLTRATYKNMKLGEKSVPPGVQLALPIILIHHDYELWGEDAKEFKPDRFSEGVLKATKNQVSFFPFGWGPRICIGQNFAMLEAKMALTMILQRFSFKLSPSYVHAPYTVVTLQPQYGAQIILHKL